MSGDCHTSGGSMTAPAKVAALKSTSDRSFVYASGKILDENRALKWERSRYMNGPLALARKRHPKSESNQLQDDGAEGFRHTCKVADRLPN